MADIGVGSRDLIRQVIGGVGLCSKGVIWQIHVCLWFW